MTRVKIYYERDDAGFIKENPDGKAVVKKLAIVNDDQSETPVSAEHLRNMRSQRDALRSANYSRDLPIPHGHSEHPHTDHM